MILENVRQMTSNITDLVAADVISLDSTLLFHLQQKEKWFELRFFFDWKLVQSHRTKGKCMKRDKERTKTVF